MESLKRLLKIDPFSLKKKEKLEIMKEGMPHLLRHHYHCCPEYKKIVDAYFNPIKKYPYLPVSLFKKYDLKSTDVIHRKIESSGTSGKRSRIYLNKEDTLNQIKVLEIIGKSFFQDDCPLLIIDEEPNKLTNLSASQVAANGFSIFGSIVYYLKDFSGFILSPFPKLIFGLTHNIYKYIYNSNYEFQNCTLIHGGGWKHIENEFIDKDSFNKSLKENNKISRIINYYGMVEQTGSIFFECEEGYFHCSNFSDIVIRDENLDVCEFNEAGLIQLFSLLPKSYPGHSILTEDIGVIRGEDDCKCGRYGKYFKVFGRAEGSELKGCSNVA